MDRTSQRSASALGWFLASSPQWPRSDALGRAEAFAQDLLNLLRQDLEPELVFHKRGRKQHITSIAQWRRKFYNQNVRMKTLQKQLLNFQVQPPTGEALARQSWPFRHAHTAQVRRGMVPGVCT